MSIFVTFLIGADVTYTDNSITVTRDLSKPLKGIDEDCGDIPDVAMTLAVVGMFAEGNTMCIYTCIQVYVYDE